LFEVVQKNDSRPRGRPKAYDAVEALHRIRDVFWIKGYAATSLDDLAEAAGMNRPSLYAAFGDKEAMYLAALKMQGEGLVNAIAGAVALEMKLKPFLSLFFDRCIESYMAGAQGQRGCFLVGTALTESLVRENVGETVREIFGRCEDMLEQRLKRAKKDGELPKTADARALAMLMSATMHELAMQARTGAARTALDQRAKLAIKLIGA
jgi:AcrR family transcriptional regulator